MEKKYFMLKLIPPHATFGQDMSPVERIVMLQHVAYLTGLAQEGLVVTFGPVLDPKGMNKNKLILAIIGQFA